MRGASRGESRSSRPVRPSRSRCRVRHADHLWWMATPGAKGGGGNHPLWALGHLAVIEGGIPQILFGEKNAVGTYNFLDLTRLRPLL